MGRYIVLVVLVALALSGLAYGLWAKSKDTYDLTMLLVGNVVLAIISTVAYVMANNALKNKNPNALIRAKMGGTMLRLFICVAGIGTYAYLNGKTPATKPTIFLLLGMCVIYIILESAVLSKKGRVG